MNLGTCDYQGKPHLQGEGGHYGNLCINWEPLNSHARALGKLGGQVKSETKAASSRENGKLGGRPKKQSA